MTPMGLSSFPVAPPVADEAVEAVDVVDAVEAMAIVAVVVLVLLLLLSFETRCCGKGGTNENETAARHNRVALPSDPVLS